MVWKNFLWSAAPFVAVLLVDRYLSFDSYVVLGLVSLANLVGYIEGRLKK